MLNLSPFPLKHRVPRIRLGITARCLLPFTLCVGLGGCRQVAEDTGSTCWAKKLRWQQTSRTGFSGRELAQVSEAEYAQEYYYYDPEFGSDGFPVDLAGYQGSTSKLRIRIEPQSDSARYQYGSRCYEKGLVIQARVTVQAEYEGFERSFEAKLRSEDNQTLYITGDFPAQSDTSDTQIETREDAYQEETDDHPEPTPQKPWTPSEMRFYAKIAAGEEVLYSELILVSPCENEPTCFKLDGCPRAATLIRYPADSSRERAAN